MLLMAKALNGKILKKLFYMQKMCQKSEKSITLSFRQLVPLYF